MRTGKEKKNKNGRVQKGEGKENGREASPQLTFSTTPLNTVIIYYYQKSTDECNFTNLLTLSVLFVAATK